MIRANCPNCETTVKLADHLKIGHKVTCSRCKERLMVLRLKPVELDWVDDADFERDAGLETGGNRRPRFNGSRGPRWSRWDGNWEELQIILGR
jgi:DNA-directed RNA polymerase subunit RPC12/RpoP